MADEAETEPTKPAAAAKPKPRDSAARESEQAAELLEDAAVEVGPVAQDVIEAARFAR